MILARATVAVAEDDPIQAELLSAWLEAHGYTVLRFPSGDDLLEWASRSGDAVDAFLLDVDMPGRNGFESCAELRKLAAYARTPALFVTAGEGASLERRASEAEETSVLPKDEAMLARLTEWLARNVVIAT